MVKVAYNACYGGFSLSKEAVLLGRKISGDPQWGGPCLAGDRYGRREEQVRSRDDNCWWSEARTDPVLIQVIETLGAAANGSSAQLKIEELEPGTQYRIEEYDGYESVKTRDSYNWETA